MSYPLKELSQLLAQENTVLGVVLETNNATVTLATSQGAVSARTLDPLKIGDRVVVRNGFATKAPTATRAFSV